MADFILKERAAKRIEMAQIILDAKGRKSWESIARLMGVSEVWLVSAVYGINAFDNAEQIVKLEEALKVNIRSQMNWKTLLDPPLKGQIDAERLKQDPLIFRLHEMMFVYGLPLKEIIEEKFGAGVMSAIDFTVNLEKVEELKGVPRVRIVLDGKFLPYKSSW